MASLPADEEKYINIHIRSGGKEHIIALPENLPKGAVMHIHIHNENVVNKALGSQILGGIEREINSIKRWA